MRRNGFVLMAVGLLLAAAPASAQDRDRNTGWWPWAGAEWERDDRYEDDRRGDRDREDRRRDRDRDERDRYERDRRAEGRRGGGPPFCRNGEGHPVHGRRWCAEKGWGSGGPGWERDRRDQDRDRDRDRWERDRDRERWERDRRDRRGGGWGEVGWEDVILRRPLRIGTVGERTVRELLGRSTLDRLGAHADRIGARGPIDGRVLARGRGSVIQLRAGGVPLAELSDLNRDGRVDLVLLARGG